MSMAFKKGKYKDKDDISRRRRHDLILIVSVVVVCALLFLLRVYSSEGRAEEQELYAVISLDGETIFRCRLSELGLASDEEMLKASSEIYEDELISFSKEGVEVRTSLGYNIISYTHGEEGDAGIYCSGADCPDRVCMDTGLITGDTEPIVCLPHRLIARLERQQ